jgi:hypothetical protein
VDHVCIDILSMGVTSKNGYKYILMVIDVFTRFTFIFPLQDKTTKTVADVWIIRINKNKY